MAEANPTQNHPALELRANGVVLNSTRPAFGQMAESFKEGESAHGLTVREYFTAAALTGILANEGLMAQVSKLRPGDTMSFVAECAVSYADEAIKEAGR
jgi:hypothetical protein